MADSGAVGATSVRSRPSHMERTVTFTVIGKPVPKGRPRVNRNGHAYTPARTLDWEAQVGWAARAAMKGREPLTGPCRVELIFRGAHGSADTDNLAKAVLDGMNTIAYLDDKQVRKLHCERAQGAPGVDVTVAELP